MRSSAQHGFLILVVLFVTLGCGTGSNTPTTQPDDPVEYTEKKISCELVRQIFSKKMDLEPLYAEQGNRCRALNGDDLSQAGTQELFTDQQCSDTLSYAGESWTTFCKNNLLGTTRTRNYIGNPDAWANVDTSITDRIETFWSLSHGTTLHLATVNQTKAHDRPYLKRVEYRRVGDCALGMHVYKQDVSAENLKPLIFLHGGGWKFRGLSAVAGIETSAPNLTGRGYIVFAPFYRLLGNSDGPEGCQMSQGTEILDDIEAAFQWVLDNGERYGMADQSGNPQISVMGQSAGGQLAAYLATYHPESIKRGILLYPAPDLGFFTANIKPNKLYDGRFEKSQQLLLSFFPQPGVTDPVDLDPSDPEIRRNSLPDVIQPDPERFPPMDMIHGKADQTVPVELTTRLCQALDPSETPSSEGYTGGDLQRGCGADSRLTVIEKGDHVLDLRCFSGKAAELIEKLLSTSELCTAGSPKGARTVRSALEDAYSKL